jgi:hypothetical protein
MLHRSGRQVITLITLERTPIGHPPLLLNLGLGKIDFKALPGFFSKKNGEAI